MRCRALHLTRAWPRSLFGDWSGLFQVARYDAYQHTEESGCIRRKCKSSTVPTHTSSGTRKLQGSRCRNKSASCHHRSSSRRRAQCSIRFQLPTGTGKSLEVNVLNISAESSSTHEMTRPCHKRLPRIDMVGPILEHKAPGHERGVRRLDGTLAVAKRPSGY